MLTLKKYRVMELMEQAGYKTQEEFAAAVGVSRTWMSALLNGRATPTTDQLIS
jgi:transcriptional regulator with XRE-family HTH domain